MAVEFNCDFAFALVAGVAHHSQPRARARLHTTRSAVQWNAIVMWPGMIRSRCPI